MTIRAKTAVVFCTLFLAAFFAGILPKKISAQTTDFTMDYIQQHEKFIDKRACCPRGTYKQLLAEPRSGICTSEFYSRTNRNRQDFPCCGWFPADTPSIDDVGTPNGNQRAGDIFSKIPGLEFLSYDLSAGTQLRLVMSPTIDCKLVDPLDLCNAVPLDKGNAACKSCKASGGLYTALGCIPRKGDELVIALARIGIGLLGGVLLIMILAAAFKLSTSRGDPKAFEEGKNMLQAGISGALFIFFSTIILELIGVRILQIPGF